MSQTIDGALQGARVLVVEDEFLIAAMAEDMLADLGATAIGPAATSTQALELIRSQAIDAVLLDVNLGAERSDRIAAELKQRGIPFVVCTGYGAVAANAFSAPLLQKPYTLESMGAALTKLLGR